MKRLTFGLGLGSLAAFAAFAAPAAFAHGGQYRAPGGGVPPGLREPTDPAPPPPTSTPPPPTTTPDTPTPPSGPTSGPVTPPAPPPPNTPPPPVTTGEDRPQGHKAQTSYDQWIFWWNYNSDDILQVKDAIYKLRMSQKSPIGIVGSLPSAPRNDATRATEEEVKRLVVPVLRWALAPENKQNPNLTSAGYIALAKVTSDPSDIALIEAGVVGKDGRKPEGMQQVVNESAAFALGLLCRGDPERQFDAKELDRVRDFLFDAFANESLNLRTRCFSMIALGLLGNQPTAHTATPISGTPVPGAAGGGETSGGGRFYSPTPDAGAETTSARIFNVLHQQFKDDQFYVASVLALSMQDPSTVSNEMREFLTTTALKGKLGKETVNELVASYAALALGRVGTDKEIKPLTEAMKMRTGANVKRSAAISLGKLASRVDGAERAALATDLWRTLDNVKESSTRNFGIISLAYIVIEDIRADRTDVINAKSVKVLDELLKTAGKDGRVAERPYGALALGLVCRQIGQRPTIEAYGKFRGDAITVLREGLAESKISRRDQGAFAIALGMMQDEGSKKQLYDILSDTKGDNELRGYCAVALGMLNVVSADIVKAIKEALHEKSSEELRLQCAIALGLLGQADAQGILLKELDEAQTTALQGQVLVALSKIGDSKAIDRIVKWVRDGQKTDESRSIACAGLGLIGDLELVPSLSKVSKDINYRATCEILNEVLSFL